MIFVATIKTLFLDKLNKIVYHETSVVSSSNAIHIKIRNLLKTTTPGSELITASPLQAKSVYYIHFSGHNCHSKPFSFPFTMGRISAPVTSASEINNSSHIMYLY